MPEPPFRHSASTNLPQKHRLGTCIQRQAEAKLATAIEAVRYALGSCEDIGANTDDATARKVCVETHTVLTKALAQIEQPQEPSREQRVAEWVITRIGAAHMQSRERTMRLAEEVFELAQAEGIIAGDLYQQLKYVFDRPIGEPRKEAAGVAVCLLGWCAANHTTFAEIADQEIARIEAKPIDQIRGSVARKTDADLVVVVEQPQEPENLGQVKQ